MFSIGERVVVRMKNRNGRRIGTIVRVEGPIAYLGNVQEESPDGCGGIRKTQIEDVLPIDTRKDDVFYFVPAELELL